VLAAQPGHSESLAQLAHAAALTCNWAGAAEFIEPLRASIDGGSFMGDCFAVLSIFDDPWLQRMATEGQSAKVGSWKAPASPSVSGSRNRMRIGYLSTDFRAHDTASIIFGGIS